MSNTAWPNQDTYQHNAQGQLTSEQRSAIRTPFPFGVYLAIAFVLLLLPGFILAFYGVELLPVIIPSFIFTGDSPLDQVLQLLMVIVLCIAFLSIVSVFMNKGTSGSRVAITLFLVWMLLAIAVTVGLGIFVGGFLLYYCLGVIAINTLIALGQIRVARRAHLSRHLPIESIDGEVRWNGRRYLGFVAQTRLWPLIKQPQIPPGRYRFQYFAKLDMLLSAEPFEVLASTAPGPLQEALSAALHFDATDLFLHRLGRLAPRQEQQWQRQVRKTTMGIYFSRLGMTWIVAFVAWVGLFFYYTSNPDTSIPYQIPAAVPLLALIILPAFAARGTWNEEQAQARAERIITWEGKIDAMRTSYIYGKIAYPGQIQLVEFTADKEVIGYLPAREARAIIAEQRYHLYLLASTREIVSAAPIADV